MYSLILENKKALRHFQTGSVGSGLTLDNRSHSSYVPRDKCMDNVFSWDTSQTDTSNEDYLHSPGAPLPDVTMFGIGWYSIFTLTCL